MVPPHRKITAVPSSICHLQHRQKAKNLNSLIGYQMFETLSIFRIWRLNKKWYTDYTYGCVSISQIYNFVNIWARASIKTQNIGNALGYQDSIFNFCDTWNEKFRQDLKILSVWKLLYFQYSLNLASDMEISYANNPWKSIYHIDDANNTFSTLWQIQPPVFPYKWNCHILRN